MTQQQNWCGNHTFVAGHVHEPQSIADAQQLIQSATRVRAVGSRHSFNDVADTPGDLIDLGALAPTLTVDRKTMTASVGAGVTYAVLAPQLHEQGFALHNLASLPHITVAGAIATGTHGSGNRNGGLASAVVGLDIIAADGSLHRVMRGNRDFEAIVVGLGAFGIVVRVHLSIEPTFAVRQDAFRGISWGALLDDFDAISSAAYSVSIITKWGGEATDHLWFKTRLDDLSSSELPAARFGFEPGPPLPPGLLKADGSAGRLTPFDGVPGPWSERLAHFEPDGPPGDPDELQSEYVLTRDRLPEAVAVLRTMARDIDPHLILSEIRTVAADAFWLSLAHGCDSVGIQFTWRKHVLEVGAITREIEAQLLPLGARPHWGKLIHASADALAPLYPRFADFQSLAKAWDPLGKFRNAFLDRHIFR